MSESAEDETLPLAVVVEDDQLLNRLFVKWLERLGYSVTSCHSGAEVLAHLRENPAALSLILLDQHLSDTNGANLYPLIREFQAEARVVVCSAFEPEGRLAAVHRAGGIGFVKKPCFFTDLVKALEPSSELST